MFGTGPAVLRRGRRHHEGRTFGFRAMARLVSAERKVSKVGFMDCVVYG